ncbi:FAD/NAD(P)-binding protein [Paenirhodobacter populi]|nr:FAD/NAD(P)-binding protein [Sinirhodobacter populi]
MTPVVIIGGGASGVLAAAHLRRRAPSVQITIIEPAPALGAGLAYGTRQPGHLLNLPAKQMSAFADDPDHFCDWLERQGMNRTAESYLPRHIYAAYLSDLLSTDLATGRVLWRRAAVTEISGIRGCYVLSLSDGGRLVAASLVLAVGHMAGQYEEAGLSNPWTSPLPTDPTARVLILGSGLSMADRTAQLLRAGHRGQIIALSRHGLAPLPHGDPHPLRIDAADLPLGCGVSYGMRWLRCQIAWHSGRGGDWRDVVDGLSGIVDQWWLSASDQNKARYLRHVRRYWDVHRHRAPPEQAEILAQAQAAGQLVLYRGRLLGRGHTNGEGFRASIRRPDGSIEGLEVAQVIDCRGLHREGAVAHSPLIRGMIGQGIARLDPLGIGLQLDPAGQLSGGTGVYVLGPMRRAYSLETASIRDIRQQASRIADLLARPGERIHAAA